MCSFDAFSIVIVRNFIVIEGVDDLRNEDFEESWKPTQ